MLNDRPIRTWSEMPEFSLPATRYASIDDVKISYHIMVSIHLPDPAAVRKNAS
jgi:hypothetical protein